MKNVGVLLKLLYILLFINIIRSELKMERLIPRVAAVHDISCVGRCSLTTIIPVLSCMGIQVCPQPGGPRRSRGSGRRPRGPGHLRPGRPGSPGRPERSCPGI